MTIDVQELLKDARLVLDYATRAGRLPDDSLPKAAGAVEKDVAAGAMPDLVPLVDALNTAVRAVAPMTLIELRAGRSPFDEKNRKSTRSFQVFLFVFSAFLMGLVAYYTELLHEADTAVKALRQVQEARPLERLHALRRMAQRDFVLQKRDSQYDQYHRAVTDLIDLQDRVSGAYQLAHAVANRAAWPFQRDLGESYPSEGAQPSEDRRDNCISLAKREDVQSKSSAKNLGTGVKPTTIGGATPTPSAAAGGSNADASLFSDLPVWLCGVVSDLRDHFEFSATLGVASNHLPMSYLVYEIQARMAALNGWLLPSLYGLLGAAVFLMRSMLDTRTANIDVFPALLRIALGGIAGIVIGWFWVPTPTKGGEMITITSAPFALAFVAGFSIDILFSLLDRLNRTITDEGVLPTLTESKKR